MRVLDLQPGQLVEMGGESATFLSWSAHPLYPGMAMVFWIMPDDHPGFGPRFGRISIDALSPHQVVGGVDPEKNSPEQCFQRLVGLLREGGEDVAKAIPRKR